MKSQAFDFDCFPGRRICLALCRPKKDLGDIKERVLATGLAVINASLILDPFVVLVAANKCLVSEANGSMKTRSLNAELLFNLSPSMHVLGGCVPACNGALGDGLAKDLWPKSRARGRALRGL